MDFLFLVTQLIQPDKTFFMKKIFCNLTALIIFVFLLITNISAQDNSIKKEKWHWGNPLQQDTSAGYVQVVKVDNVLYISGAVARDVTPEGITRVYQSLERSLKSFGASFQNVVKENLFTTDIEAMKKYNAARKVFYNGDIQLRHGLK